MEVELNKQELERLFKETIKNIEKMEESIMFNLYEDLEVYSMEATFDDEEVVICRENPAILCLKEYKFKDVLKAVRIELKTFCEANKEKLKKAKEISFGFVDGDLFYIKKARKSSREIKKFTADDFKDFSPSKLEAWITVYMTDEARKKYKASLIIKKIRRWSMRKWRKRLAENFDYEKYNRNY